MLSLAPFSAANDDEAPFVKGHGVHSLEALERQDLIIESTPELEEATSRHPVALTPVLLDLIDPDDPCDPIARQFVPSPLEVIEDDRARMDPIGDETNSPLPGIIHRYPDRLLLNLLHVCPAYCRFCFRRSRVGEGKGVLSPEDTGRALEYIREHKEVWEVILSGGEPLMLSTRRLREILIDLRSISHVRALRIHTRAPITMPEKMTPELVRLLAGGSKPMSLLIHCNHPRELSPAALGAIGRLADAGLSLYSQSVLLKGVNDDPEILATLMRRFVECRIKPHYLHHPDLARGTKHFRVSLNQGIDLVQQLHDRLSGLCQPRYMLDIPGGHGKVNILSGQVKKANDGWLVKNFKGQEFLYKE